MNERELEQIYDAHASGLFRYLFTFTKTEADAKDLLQELFALQATLNDRIFEKRGLRGSDGRILSTERLADAAVGGAIAPGSDVSVWMSNYLRALQEEGRELSEEIPWKWWSKESLDMDDLHPDGVHVQALLGPPFPGDLLGQLTAFFL